MLIVHMTIYQFTQTHAATVGSLSQSLHLRYVITTWYKIADAIHKTLAQTEAMASVDPIRSFPVIVY